MPITSRVVLGEGAADWSRLQSLFGLMRAHGARRDAWPGPCKSARVLSPWRPRSFVLWRSRALLRDQSRRPRRRRAARDALHLYVRPRRARRRRCFSAAPFTATRIFRCPTSALLPLPVSSFSAFPYVKTQVGLAAVLIVAALVVQRALAERNRFCRQKLRLGPRDERIGNHAATIPSCCSASLAQLACRFAVASS